LYFELVKRRALARKEERRKQRKQTKTPIILLPFVMLGIGQMKAHRDEANARMKEAELHEKEYQLLLAEHNARYGAKTTTK
jgi:hypothetical protein